MEGRSVGYNFERDPPKDHTCQVWFNLVQRFQRRRFNCLVYFIQYLLYSLIPYSSVTNLVMTFFNSNGQFILGWNLLSLFLIQIYKISKTPALSHNIIMFYSVLDKDDGHAGNVINISNTASIL
jgi:hypothetical protein